MQKGLMADDWHAATGRLLKNMSTMGVIIETGANEYRSTALSKTLTIKKFTDGYPGMYVPSTIQSKLDSRGRADNKSSQQD
jgi:hypothetical protein